MHKNTINNCPYCGEELTYVPREGVPHLCMVEIGPKSFSQKTERNVRMQKRYNELMKEGKHGHYETMFQVWQEEQFHSYTQGWNAAITQINNNLSLRGLWFHENDGTIRQPTTRDI